MLVVLVWVFAGCCELAALVICFVGCVGFVCLVGLFAFSFVCVCCALWLSWVCEFANLL